MKVSTEILARTVRTIRLALGETQVEMAQRIGVSPSALYRWERGESRPHKIALRALLALCPDEESRANFFVDIGEIGSKIRSTPRAEVPKEKEEASRPGAMNDRGRIAPKHYKPGPKGR